MNGERLPPAASAPLAGGLLAALALAALVALAALGCGAPTSGKSAAELYGEHCSRCHGSDGRGDPRGPTPSPQPAFFRSLV